MFVGDTYPSLCLDKRDIVLEESNACHRLLEYTTEYNIDEIDKKTIEEEILGKIAKPNSLMNTNIILYFIIYNVIFSSWLYLTSKQK